MRTIDNSPTSFWVIYMSKWRAIRRLGVAVAAGHYITASYSYGCLSTRLSRYRSMPCTLINGIPRDSVLTADFSSVRIFHDCVKHSVASSVALYTTETIQVDSSC